MNYFETLKLQLLNNKNCLMCDKHAFNNHQIQASYLSIVPTLARHTIFDLFF